MEESEQLPARRFGQKRYWFGAFFLLLLLALAILWTQRVPLARGYIDDQLSQRGVTASYEITEFAPTRQRIENLVIGDPDNPDLTAEWAELHVRLGFGVPEIRRIEAHGVRLNGALVDGQFRFGQIDRLLPEPSGEPITLPEIDVALSDTLLRLATPYGPMVVGLTGAGPLHDGFAGFTAGRSPRLTIEGCDVRQAGFDVEIAVRDRRPAILGPVRAANIDCADQDMAIADAELAVDAILSEAFDRWGGESGVSLASLRSGGNRIEDISGRIGFDGAADETTSGFVRLAAAGLQSADAGANATQVSGFYRYRPDRGSLSFDADMRLDTARVSPAMLASLTDNLRAAAGTPFGPVGDALAAATDRAASRFDANFSIAGAVRGNGGAVRLTDLAARSRSGARLLFEGGDGINASWPEGGPRFDGEMRLRGGGFPEMLVALEQERAGAPLVGFARVAPFSVGQSRLALAPVSFTSGGGSLTRIMTVLDISGPLADGRVENLRVPIAGTLGRGGDLRLGQGCTPVSWARLRVASLTIGQTQLPLCPLNGGALLRYDPSRGLDGGARIARPRIRATLGSTPLAIAASDILLPIAAPSFAARDVTVRLGPAGSQSELDIASLRADFVSGGVDGEYRGAAGQLASVPVRLSESDGDWRFVNGILDVAGDGMVTSTASSRMFEPLGTDNMALHLENNRITMTSTLAAPQNGAEIANVDLFHNLNSGAGEAVLATERIEFNERLQPSDLTNLVLGVIAEVEGLASGTGTIRWDPAGNVTSDGVYQMTDIDLAAPFGPVEGLNGEIHFTDLLGLNTEPGQVATLRETNPGVLVLDGDITYQLLDANRVQIEGARWPFAGGELILRPTIIDFRVDKVRELTFDVRRVDAFQFLESRDFENIIATGLFDGTLPMVFDNMGGRIVGGYLVSRQPGGTFSYTGEISDVNLGLMGTLAFNALELIRYSELTIRFDGAIDGEMVTNVEFTGVSPNIAREGQGFLLAGFTRELSDIPIRFDITLEAPFNQLLYSMRLLDDPGFLVNQAIQARISRMRAERGVQGPESDIMP